MCKGVRLKNGRFETVMYKIKEQKINEREERSVRSGISRCRKK